MRNSRFVLWLVALVVLAVRFAVARNPPWFDVVIFYTDLGLLWLTAILDDHDLVRYRLVVVEAERDAYQEERDAYRERVHRLQRAIRDFQRLQHPYNCQEEDELCHCDDSQITTGRDSTTL